MSNPHTHGVFIQLPDNGTAFIDGIKDKCEHNYTGDEVLFTQSGKIIYWHTYRQWASLTSQIRNQFIYDHQEEIGDPINGGAVTCKKCKMIFNPPMF